MGKTCVTISGEHFYINGQKTYSEISGNDTSVHGLLMNARFIQGVFDDKIDRARFSRFGRVFDPDNNTDALIKALQEWYNYGLRAFTVGLQGGGPCFTINNSTIENNPYGSNGKSLDPQYAARMDRLIKAADEIGMVVIVSFFYASQAKRLENGRAVREAVKTASKFLKENGYSNVLIEVANEYDNDVFECHPLLNTTEGMVSLIDLAREASGGMLVGSSGSGGSIHKEVCEASDFILIHGNGCSRQIYYNLIAKAKKWGPGKPIVCNEDSPAIGQLKVAFKTSTSWGYYNNATKQEPQADFSITKGDDTFFAYRMAEGLGIKLPEIGEDDQYYFQGMEKDFEYDGKRWLKISCLYPEKVDYVEFYKNSELIYTCFDEPFALYFNSNWHQGPCIITTLDKELRAVIYLRDGRKLERVISL